MFWIALGVILIFGIGMAVIPTSIHDKRARTYKPKITAADFKFDPLKTKIASVYKEKLKQKSLSGASVIENGMSAFVVRAALSRMAERTIDLQTYIYSNDLSSHVLLQEMRMAADRGVKVRILVDDNGTNSDIADVMLLNMHPNIEVKVFNTFKYRSRLARYPQFLFDFNRLNSRMHNKLFIVDGIAVVVGGRNIGSNYFYPETSANFSDTDVLFLGHIAKEAAKSFNEYWTHHLAIPASLFPDRQSKRRVKKLQKQFEKMVAKSPRETKRYNKVVNYAKETYLKKKGKFYWGNGKLIADAPSKIEKTKKQKLKDKGPIVRELNKLWKTTAKDIHISAAYFVPGKWGAKNLIWEGRKGINITVVTNSLSSTNQPSVYGKWEKYRKRLIKNGVNVYEFMNHGHRKIKRKKFSLFTSLHSKTIVFDNKLSWIGSFNLDPRSALYNTEIITVFNHREFSGVLKRMIESDIKNSWKVTYENGRTTWTGIIPGNKKPTVMKHSPDATLIKRILWKVMRIVPERLV